jgi:hypothetical protein
MEQLIPVLFVTAFITFILMKQIKHVTKNLPEGTQESSDFIKYANFSVSVQNYIRIIKNDIDSTKEKDGAKFVLKESIDEKESIELLADFLRKLVFFETLLAKNKTSQEIESELFAILDSIDNFVREKCENGEELADELKEFLYNDFQNA